MKTKIIIFIILNVFGFLLTTLGNVSYLLSYNVNYFWVTAVIQTVGSIFFGWTGVLAGVTYPIFANAITDPTYISILYFIPANFVQSFLPFYLFRKFNCDIRLRGYKSIFCFSLTGAIIPQFCGGMVALTILIGLGEITSVGRFLWLIFLWVIGAVPWIIIFGIPIIKILTPILREYGLLFGERTSKVSDVQEYNEGKIKTLYSSSLPILLKVFSALLLVGIVPISALGVYEIVINKGSPATLELSAILIWFALFGTLILTGVLTNAIISPIKKLSKGIAGMTAENLDYQIEIVSNDELGKLAIAFNDMAKTLKEHTEERKRAEDDARKAREEKYETELSSERAHAIASTTSIVAHDVRKPFTQLKAMLAMLPHLKEEEISTYSGELDLSLRKVDAMLSDIMEFTRDAEYTVIPENILVVLDLSIKDTSRYNLKKKVEFYYDLETLNLINLDEQRLSRAFDNIIGNAFEAMPKENAFMWFLTKGYKDHSEVIIGNSGSHIPEDQIDKIFDNKFTSGKKSGTGLGLGIVKKVIKGHSGSVIARNVEHAPDFVPDNIRDTKGVEFVVTLPITKIGGYELKDSVLNNSQEAKIQYGMVDKKNQLAGSLEIDTLVKKLEKRSERARILILDDESIYRMRVKNVWDKLPEVKTLTRLFDASSYKEAIEILDHTKIYYLICDIDLSDKKKNGFDVLKFTKEKYHDCRVIMHTNRREPEDISRAKELGACGFCPKPITEAIFVDLLSDKELWPSKTEKVKKISKADEIEVEQQPKTKKNILFLNDDKMLNFSVKISLKNSKYFVETFTNVDDALSYYRKNKVCAIFSDIDLQNTLNGYDFLKEIRAKDKDIPFIFVSGSLRDTEWPKAKKLGATEYFQLPIEEELEKVIDSFVKKGWEKDNERN